jgi:hypothetical protein
MRTKFTVSMAAAGALLATTVAVPTSTEQSTSAAQVEELKVERTLFAAGANSIRRPQVGVSTETESA